MSPSASTGPAGFPRKLGAAGVEARVRHALAWRTRLPRALKAALAATLAWLVVQPLGGPADQYAYYAPLGAVIAISVTVVDSASAAVQGVVAILLGAALAVLAVELVPGTPAGLAAVVLLGTVVAGWWRLGDMGSWVPIAALFVLTIGSSGLVDYSSGTCCSRVSARSWGSGSARSCPRCRSSRGIARSRQRARGSPASSTPWPTVSAASLRSGRRSGPNGTTTCGPRPGRWTGW